MGVHIGESLTRLHGAQGLFGVGAGSSATVAAGITAPLARKAAAKPSKRLASSAASEMLTSKSKCDPQGVARLTPVEVARSLEPMSALAARGKVRNAMGCLDG